jgi:hypothetical protein
MELAEITVDSDAVVVAYPGIARQVTANTPASRDAERLFDQVPATGRGGRAQR